MGRIQDLLIDLDQPEHPLVAAYQKYQHFTEYQPFINPSEDANIAPIKEANVKSDEELPF